VNAAVLRDGITAGRGGPSRWLVAFMVTAFATGLAGCEASPPDGRAGAARAADSSAASSPASGVPAPAEIEAVAASGEDLYDRAKAGEWEGAHVALNALGGADRKLPPAPIGMEAQRARLGEAIAALAKSVGERNRLAAMDQANTVTWIATELAAGFETVVPVEVAKLDYYGREFEIGAQAGDDNRLRQAALGASRAWQALRPLVEERGGRLEARTFGALVARAEAARTPADFGRLATPLLDQVDRLELVFERP
jgi:hypothetical protein